jgi:hypothetical protein
MVWCPIAIAETVPLDVDVQLTDPDEKPLPDIPLRVVFSCDKDWQMPNSGHRFVTDANGAAAFETKVSLDKLTRKRSTSFMGRMVSIPQQVDHLKIAAEMEYKSQQLLYAVDVVSFPGGDSTIDDFSIYATDKNDRFTRAVDQDRNGWKIKAANGDLITTPGYEPWKYILRPDPKDPAGRRWILRLAFKKPPS